MAYLSAHLPRKAGITEVLRLARFAVCSKGCRPSSRDHGADGKTTYFEFITETFLRDYLGRSGRPASTWHEEAFSETGRMMIALGHRSLTKTTDADIQWFQRSLESKLSASTVRKHPWSQLLSTRNGKRTFE